MSPRLVTAAIAAIAASLLLPAAIPGSSGAATTATLQHDATGPGWLAFGDSYASGDGIVGTIRRAESTFRTGGGARVMPAPAMDLLDGFGQESCRLKR